MTLNLDAKKREIVGKKVATIREDGLIPAILYGHGIDNINLALDYNSFEKLYAEAGESTLVDLKVDGNKLHKVLVADIQKDPVKNRIIHVDFQQVKMDEKITATVELEFIGESKAVKELSGTLIRNFDELEIKCLPGDLISKIEVSISGLNEFGDSIAIKDLNLPQTVEVVHDQEEIVATVVAPKEEEEVIVSSEAEETSKAGEKTESEKSSDANEAEQKTE